METAMGGNGMRESNGEQAIEPQTEPKTRHDWIVHALRDLQSDVLSRSTGILDAMREEAEASKTMYIEKMLDAQRAYPPAERGSISMRVRNSAKSGPGMFQIEWFRVKGPKRTHYLKRGKDRDGKIRHGYSIRSFGQLTGWEKDLIDRHEPRFEQLRAIQSHLSQIRMRLRMIEQECQAPLKTMKFASLDDPNEE
jgi:hypothetical protein